MKREVISYNYRVNQHVEARFYVNDLPLHQGTVKGQRSRNGGLNDRLVPGENELRIELVKCPPSMTFKRPATTQNEKDARETIRRQLTMSIFKAGPDGPEDLNIIADLVFPDVWDEREEERWQTPYHYVTQFDPGVEPYALAFLSAPSTEVPCEGTVELRRAVEELYEALAARDKAKLVDLMALQIEEMAAAYEGTGPTVGTQLEAYDEFFADEVDVVPLVPSQLHFASRCKGRVVEVTCLDDHPVLAAMTRNTHMAHASDLLFIRQGERWRLM